MAPHTPVRRVTSEPFITLSVSKSAASTLVQHFGLTPSSAKSDPTMSVTKVKKSPPKKAAQKERETSSKKATTTNASSIRTPQKGDQSVSASPSSASIENGGKLHKQSSRLCSQLHNTNRDRSEKSQSEHRSIPSEGFVNRTIDVTHGPLSSVNPDQDEGQRSVDSSQTGEEFRHVQGLRIGFPFAEKHRSVLSEEFMNKIRDIANGTGFNVNPDRNEASKSEHRVQTSVDHTMNEIQGVIGIHNERRSSTASLTDGGMRSSGRTRKLTRKAQALAGTNFLPSLQNAGDTGTVSGSFNDASPIERPTAIGGAENYQSVDTLEPKVDEASIESDETPTVRSSARERKPTSRAIEIGNMQASRKRPASPSFIDRASKIVVSSPPTSARSTRLRQSILSEKEAGRDTPTLTPAKQKEEPSTADIEMAELDFVDAEASASQDQNTNHVQAPPESLSLESSRNSPQANIQDQVEMHVAKHDLPISEAHSQKVANQAEAQTDDLDQQPIHQSSTISATRVAISSDNQTQKEANHNSCGLKCLSPSARLLAFARFAANMSDDDGEDSDDDDLDTILAADSFSSDTTTYMDELNRLYCQCQTGAAKSHLHDGKHDVQKPPQTNESTPRNGLVAHGLDKEQQPLNCRRSAREKPVNSRYRPEMPPAKRQKMNQPKSTLLRQSSSFEQRMRNDYIAAKAEKYTRAGLKSHMQEESPPYTSNSDGLQTSRSISTSGSVKPSKTQSIHASRAHSLILSNSQYESNGMPHPHTSSHATNLSILPPTSNSKSNAPSSKQQLFKRANIPVSASVKLSIDDKKTKSATNTAIKSTKGSDRPVDDGLVHNGLQDKAGHIERQDPNQNSGIVPPQAKSIKLRFTTAAK